jgi:cytochrome P450
MVGDVMRRTPIVHRSRIRAVPPVDPIAAATDPDPYEFYACLVAERPMYYDQRLQLWVAAGAAAVSEVLANSRCRVRPAFEPVPKSLAGSVAGQVFGSLVRMSDGERHRELKLAVRRAFESLPLPTVERTSVEHAHGLANRNIVTDDRTAVTRFMFRLPIYVIAILLGVPESELPEVADATEAFATALAPVASVEQQDRGSAAAERLQAVVAPLVSNAVMGPNESLLDAFRRAARAESITEDRIIANGIGFLFQSCDATAGLIGNTIVTLGRRADVLERVTREPQDLRAAIEEVIRFDSPVQNTRRFVESPGLVAGESMKAGDVVLVLLAAANRDPAANPDPGRFDLRRSNRQVFTFGAGGHACPGGLLAVTIATAGVRRLLEVGVDPRPLAEAFSYRPSVNLRIPVFGAR